MSNQDLSRATLQHLPGLELRLRLSQRQNQASEVRLPQLIRVPSISVFLRTRRFTSVARPSRRLSTTRITLQDCFPPERIELGFSLATSKPTIKLKYGSGVAVQKLQITRIVCWRARGVWLPLTVNPFTTGVPRNGLSRPTRDPTATSIVATRL